ncbi:hypothetical protein D3C78_866330 [compost metagenome]
MVSERIVAQLDLIIGVANPGLRKLSSANQLVAAAMGREQAVFEDVLRLDLQLFDVLSGRRRQCECAHHSMYAEGRQPVPGHDQASHELGQVDHGLCMGLALLVVGAQYRSRGLATQYPGEFPGKVGDIAKPGNQALSDEGGGDVSGIPYKEHASLAEAGAAARVESIHRLALDL